MSPKHRLLVYQSCSNPPDQTYQAFNREEARITSAGPAMDSRSLEIPLPAPRYKVGVEQLVAGQK